MYNINFSIADHRVWNNESQAKKAYACTQLSDVVSFKDFARHVASHGSTYSRADITAVCTLVVDCLLEMMKDGKKVQLGELGNFYPQISSEGAESATDFTTNNIRKLYAVWERGEDFKDFSHGVTFTYTPTRAAQKAVSKAQKAGANTVDISKKSTSNAEAAAGGINPSGTGSGTGNPSGGTPSGTGTGGNGSGNADGDED